MSSVEYQITEKRENWTKEYFSGIRVPIIEVFSEIKVLITNISILAFNNGLQMYSKQKRMAALKTINCMQIR